MIFFKRQKRILSTVLTLLLLFTGTVSLYCIQPVCGAEIISNTQGQYMESAFSGESEEQTELENLSRERTEDTDQNADESSSDDTTDLTAIDFCERSPDSFQDSSTAAGDENESGDLRPEEFEGKNYSPDPFDGEESDAEESDAKGSDAEASTIERTDTEASGTDGTDVFDTENSAGENSAPAESDTDETAPAITKPVESAPADPAGSTQAAGEETSRIDLEQEQSGSGSSTQVQDAEAIKSMMVPDAPGETESFVPVEEGEPATDNDDVFSAYVNRELGLTGGLKADTGDFAVSTPARRSNYASTHLSGYNLTVYGLLYKKIRQVAAGELTSTLFTVTPEDLGLSEKKWTAEELGVEAIVVDNKITAESKTALNSILGISFRAVNKSLLADCPVDLYWYDKTATARSVGFTYAASLVDGEYRLYLKNQYTFTFPVSKEYSLSDEENTLETDPGTGTSVTAAKERARSIVVRYEDASDYEKLDGYRKEICELTSYNSKAAGAGSSTPYGNPWQLIWVFDDDPQTEVVCEGYAKAFQYLCDLSSFHSIFRECLSVTGKMQGGTGAGGHMWNIVSLRDGRSYLVDVTNCDQGTIGSGNGGRGLFLVGTGESTGDDVLAGGSLQEGYTFPFYINLTYVYDSDTFDRFDDEILTLAQGRADAQTTADGPYEGTHSHIYLPAPAVDSTCIETGHSAGGQCAICDAYDETVLIYPLADHSPGTWSVLTAATYDNEGLEETCCTVCGDVLTRVVPKLIPATGITLNRFSAELATTKTLPLKATVLPFEASDREISWVSSDPSVASVDGNGLVRARKYGTATISAKTYNGITAKVFIQTRFYDVTIPGKSCYEPVYWAVDEGITTCSVYFRPEDPVTRGEFVAFLWRLAGRPKSSAKVPFKDVDTSTGFYSAIRWAAEKGIIKGYTDGTFRPDRKVTRGETATMLWRYAGKPVPKMKKSPFSDVPITEADSCRAILWGYENGIIMGSGGKFLKSGSCTRGQTVTFLYRYIH